MTKIYLIRHAEAEGNLYRRIHGWYNSLITDNGYQQIAALEARFREIPIDAVYASDLFRTMTTAKAIAPSRGLTISPCSDLREVNMGDWEDETWAEVAQRDAHRLALFNSASPDWIAPNGESLQTVQTRVLAAIKTIADHHDGQTVAVFSHGMAIRAVLTALHGLSIGEMNQIDHGDNTAVTLVEFVEGQWSVVFENDATHLNSALSTFAQQQWWKEGGGACTEDVNLWYRPLNMEKQGDFFYQCREEAWLTVHKSLLNFDGDGFLADAKRQTKQQKNALWQVMAGDTPAGLLHLDIDRDADKSVGWIPFFYLLPDHRRRGVGVQLLGQAVSVFRPLGRQYLRLRCAPDNEVAQRFYRRNGFTKVGQAQGTRVPLDILQKYIGYN